MEYHQKAGLPSTEPNRVVTQRRSHDSRHTLLSIQMSHSNQSTIACDDGSPCPISLGGREGQYRAEGWSLWWEAHQALPTAEATLASASVFFSGEH